MYNKIYLLMCIINCIYVEYIFQTIATLKSFSLCKVKYRSTDVKNGDEILKLLYINMSCHVSLFCMTR